MIASKTSYWYWDLQQLRSLVARADQARLRAAGDPFPEQPFYVLYRGVAGAGRQRHIRGLSWTSPLAQAQWFARRWDDLPDPAVYVVRVPAEHVWAYTNEHQEDEYVLLLPPRWPIRRLRVGASVA